MDRLPIKFEDEVLEPAEIYWGGKDSYEIEVDCGEFVKDVEISPYEIAARGFQAIGGCVCKLKGLVDYGYRWSKDDISVVGKDFNECVFKAVNEIWGEE
jgi:hypothetical protein